MVYLPTFTMIYLSTYHDLVFREFFPKKPGVAFDHPRFCSEKNTCRHHIFPGGDMTGQEVIFTMLLRMIIPGPSSTHNPINPLFFLRVEKLATNFLRLPKVVLKISDMAQIPGKKTRK